jgi:hypothetical protein
MKQTFLTLGALFLLAANSMAGPAAEQTREFARLYDCSRKLHRGNPAYNHDHEVEIIAEDLFYSVDKRTPALYLFTPCFAGKADLSGDKWKPKIPAWDGKLPYTLQNSDNTFYHVRIPYFPDDPKKTKGYYYMTVTDSIKTIYDQPYYENGKTRIKRLDPPQIIGPHNAGVNSPSKFLPGAPQKLKGVEYLSLDIENKLWKKNAPDNYSRKAMDLVYADLASRIRNMPPEHKVGDGSGCPGAGCNWTWSEAMVAAEHKTRQDALDTCKAVDDEFHLGLFSSKPQ